MNAPDHERLHILSVEDEPLNRVLLRAILERAEEPRLREASLTDAASLAEGRAVLAAGVFDLVLLDKRLPDGDGLDLARDIRNRAASARPIVIALTADAVPSTRAAATGAGCAELVVKPYRAEELVAAIMKALDAVENGRHGNSGLDDAPVMAS